MEYKKYSVQELSLIFDLDFTKFLKLSAYHKENNLDYFNSVIVPYYLEQKKLGKVPDYNSVPNKNEATKNNPQTSSGKTENYVGEIQNSIQLHTPAELEIIASSDPVRFKELMAYYYDKDYNFFEKTVHPIMRKLKEKENTKTTNQIEEYEKLPISNVKNDLSDNIKYYGPHNSVKIKRISSVHKRRNIIISTTIVLILIITSLVYYFVIYNNNYNQAIRYLKNKEFIAAYSKLSNIDTTSTEFYNIKSKYYFAKGGSEFDKNNIRNAYIILSKVDNNDELYGDVKALLTKINTEPTYIYQKGLDHLKVEEFDLASSEFKKIKLSDNNFHLAQSKLAYLNGLLEYNNARYENANNLFQQVDKSDEYYSKILEMQPQIEEFMSNKADNEINSSYARFLIRVSDEIQDEYQLMTTRSTFDYIKFTYLPKLISLRSEINRYSYDAKKKSQDLVDFKKTIINWVNSYIKYGEAIGEYGYSSNYRAENMWNDYGYILRGEKETGSNLHDKVVKKYKNIKLSFNIN